MKKMFKVLLFPIWLVLEVVVFVLKLVMVLSSTVLGILLRILVPMAFVAMLLSVRNGLMLLACAWLISPIGLPWVAEFNIGAILSVVAVYLVSATETIGDTSALCNGAPGQVSPSHSGQ